MKKGFLSLLGAGALLAAFALNLNYAVNDYGIIDNEQHACVLAQSNSSDGGNTSGGDTSGGNTSGGDTSGNGWPFGADTGGDTSGGNTSGGDTSGGDTSGGDTSGCCPPLVIKYGYFRFTLDCYDAFGYKKGTYISCNYKVNGPNPVCNGTSC
jgi:hypothetical protein